MIAHRYRSLLTIMALVLAAGSPAALGQDRIGSKSAQKGTKVKNATTIQTGGPVAYGPGSAARVSMAAGVLSITTGNASDSFTLFVGEEGPGSVVLNAVPGIPDGTVYLGISAIVISTAGGNDKVEVFASGEAFPTLTVDTGTGQNEVIAQYNATLGAVASEAFATVTGHSGGDKVSIIVNSDALGFTGTFDLNLGNGFNDTSVQWISNTPGADALNLRVRGGTSVDTLAIQMESLLSSPTLNLDAALGAGIDIVSADVKSISGGELLANLSLDLGTGNDTAIFNFAEPALATVTGTILGGTGSDVIEMQVKQDLTGAFTINSGAGNDTIKVVVPSQILGAPRLLAEGGNDIVELSGSLGLGGAPFSNGGAGFDAFKGVGAYVNFEQVN